MGTHYKGNAKTVRALDGYIKLMRAANSVSHQISLALAKHRLTISQFGILEALLHLGTSQQHTLGEKLLRSGGNITTVVDNLEKRGLIERERCSDDRRCIWVKLTAEGTRLISGVFPEVAEMITQSMGKLTREELLDFGDYCKRVGITASEAMETST